MKHLKIEMHTFIRVYMFDCSGVPVRRCVYFIILIFGIIFISKLKLNEARVNFIR